MTPVVGTFGGMSIKNFGQFSSSEGGLFNFSIGTSYTIRPITFGSFGMSQSRWDTIFSALSAPWFSNRLPNVTYSQVINHYNNPNEVARGNPEPGGIFSIKGFPLGTYEITLAGGAGADADPGFGAPGGIGTFTINIDPSMELYFSIGQGGIYTGGASRSSHTPWYYPNPGGWNGGGAAGAQNSSAMYSGSGGGSTDIKLNGTSLSNRIAVVGGGGGATDQNYNTGGAGGGFNQNGQNGGYNPSFNAAGAGQGGTTSAGGSGARKSGVVYESYMNGKLWEGGRGYDGTQPVNSANAAGGGGGGYYGGGGAVDESYPDAGGTGGGSGYLNTSVATLVSTSIGGANNGHPSWTLSAPSVNGSGKTDFVLYNVSSYDPSSTSSDNTRYSNYRSDGSHIYINRRWGKNGWITIKRIS
jgi:hypothetical protein